MNNRDNQLLKNGTGYLLTGLLNQAITLLLWLMLGWYLVPLQIGIYTLAIFIIEVFGALCVFGFDSAIIRFYFEREEKEAVLTNALLIFPLSAILSLFIFHFASEPLSNAFPGLRELIPAHLWLLSSLIVTNAFSNLIFIHWIALRKVMTYAKFQILRTLLFFCFALLLVKSGFGILGVLYSLLISGLLLTAVFLYLENKCFSFNSVSVTLVKAMLGYACPLMLYAVFNNILNYYGRLLLDRFSSLAALGTYSFFFSITLQVNGLWPSLNKAWTPEIFSELSHNRQEALRRVTTFVFGTTFLYLIGLAAFVIVGDLFLFSIIFKPSYLSQVHLFFLTLLGPLFTAIYTGIYPLFYFEKRTSTILYLSLLISTVNLILTYYLVLRFQALGAALSWCFVSALTVVCYMIGFRKRATIPGSLIKLVLMLCFFLMLSAALLLFTASNPIFAATLTLIAVYVFISGDLLHTTISLGQIVFRRRLGVANVEG